MIKKKKQNQTKIVPKLQVFHIEIITAIFSLVFLLTDAQCQTKNIWHRFYRYWGFSYNASFLKNFSIQDGKNLLTEKKT